MCAELRPRLARASVQSDLESPLCAQSVTKDSRLLHANIEDSDQTELMHRLVRVAPWRTATLLISHGLWSCAYMYVQTDGSLLFCLSPSWKPIFSLFESGRFTQVLLYIYSPSLYVETLIFCHLQVLRGCKRSILSYSRVLVQQLSYIEPRPANNFQVRDTLS